MEGFIENRCIVDTNGVVLFSCEYTRFLVKIDRKRRHDKQARHFLSSLSALRHGRRPIPPSLLQPVR